MKKKKKAIAKEDSWINVANTCDVYRLHADYATTDASHFQMTQKATSSASTQWMYI